MNGRRGRREMPSFSLCITNLLSELEINERSDFLRHELDYYLNDRYENNKFHDPWGAYKPSPNTINPPRRDGMKHHYERHHQKPHPPHLNKRQYMRRGKVGEYVFYYQP